MQERLNLQKDLLHRILRLHALRSSEESFELLQLAIDDTLIFDLVYNQIMEKVDADAEVETTRSGMDQVLVQNLGQVLYWLSSRRSQLLTEINSIVASLGGIEIATYLIEDQASEAYRLD